MSTALNAEARSPEVSLIAHGRTLPADRLGWLTPTDPATPGPSPSGELPLTGGGDPGWAPFLATLALGGGIMLLVTDTLVRTRGRRRT